MFTVLPPFRRIQSDIRSFRCDKGMLLGQCNDFEQPLAPVFTVMIFRNFTFLCGLILYDGVTTPKYKKSEVSNFELDTFNIKQVFQVLKVKISSFQLDFLTDKVLHPFTKLSIKLTLT